MKQNEEWRIIPSYPEYAVSESGRIKRMVPNGRNHKLKELSVQTAQSGYKTVRLYRDGRQTVPLCVHRLVLESFVGRPPSSGHQAAHNDGSRDNNHYLNLRWATPKENAADKRRHGTHLSGNRHPNAKLRSDNISEIFRLANTGHTQRQIAALFNVSQRTLARVLHNKTWEQYSKEKEYTTPKREPESYVRGEKQGSSIVTASIVRCIRRRCAAGEKQIAVGKDFGITQSAVSLIVRRKNWSHVS